MPWDTIKTEEDYQKAIARTLQIFHAAPNSPEEAELALLLSLVKKYEEQYIHLV